MVMVEAAPTVGALKFGCSMSGGASIMSILPKRWHSCNENDPLNTFKSISKVWYVTEMFLLQQVLQ